MRYILFLLALILTALMGSDAFPAEKILSIRVTGATMTGTTFDHVCTQFANTCRDANATPQQKADLPGFMVYTTGEVDGLLGNQQASLNTLGTTIKTIGDSVNDRNKEMTSSIQAAGDKLEKKIADLKKIVDAQAEEIAKLKKRAGLR